MKVGSLYSNAIDGFAYAAQKLGMEVCWQVEINKEYHRYLNKNYPESEKHQYDGYVGKRNLEKVDIICGGDPCQPHSVSGVRRGKTDDRYRWPEMYRIIDELRPNWVINENVAGTISNMVLDQKITDLEKIGYTCQSYVIPAVAVNAWHIRNRVFLIAYANVYGRGGYYITTKAQAQKRLNRQLCWIHHAILFYNLNKGWADHRFSLMMMGYPTEFLDLDQQGTQLSLIFQ